MRGALREPQVLEARPGTVVTLAGRRAAAAGTTVGTSGLHGSKSSTAPSRGQTPPSTDSSAFAAGTCGIRSSSGPRAGGQPLAQGAQIGSGLHRVPARARALRPSARSHPRAAHRTGSRCMPSARAAATAARGSSGPRKNIEPPAPEPAALPPSAPALASPARAAPSPACTSPASSRCCSRQFSLSSPPSAARSAGAERLRHPLGDRPEAVERAAPRQRRPARRRASPGRSCRPRTRDAPV